MSRIQIPLSRALRHRASLGREACRAEQHRFRAGRFGDWYQNRATLQRESHRTMYFAACMAAVIEFETQQQRLSWSLLAHRHIDSQEVENRLEQCIRGDAEAPSLALYPKGPALLRVVQTQDQLEAPTVARMLCPDRQDLKAVTLPCFACPHPAFTVSLCECELKLVMQQLAISLQGVILNFTCRGMP